MIAHDGLGACTTEQSQRNALLVETAIARLLHLAVAIQMRT